MKLFIAILLYFVIAIIYIIIGSITFKPLEGDYEIDMDGNAYERDEETQRSEMVARGLLWPISLSIIVIMSPIVLVDRLSKKIIEKRNGKENS